MGARIATVKAVSSPASHQTMKLRLVTGRRRAGASSACVAMAWLLLRLWGDPSRNLPQRPDPTAAPSPAADAVFEARIGALAGRPKRRGAGAPPAGRDGLPGAPQHSSDPDGAGDLPTGGAAV